MNTPKVLFVCSHRGARSRIAEAYCRDLAGTELEAHCACFQSGGFGSMVAQLMEEDGLHLPKVDVPSVYRHFSRDVRYDYVIFMCDDAIREVCELFENDMDQLFSHGEIVLAWQVPPFSELAGEPRERIAGGRRIRDTIRRNVEELIAGIRADDVAERFTPVTRPGPEQPPAA